MTASPAPETPGRCIARTFGAVAAAAALALSLFPSTSGAAAAERLELVVGGGTATNRPPALALETRLMEPFGVAFDSDRNMFIAEMSLGQRILRVDPRGRLTSFAGTGIRGAGGDVESADRVSFDGVHNLVVTPDNAVLIADTWNHRVRRIDPRTHIVTTLAGTGRKGFGGDGGLGVNADLGTGRKGSGGINGPPLEAELNRPHGVTIAPDGSLYIVDSYNNRILRVRR